MGHVTWDTGQWQWAVVVMGKHGAGALAVARATRHGPRDPRTRRGIWGILAHGGWRVGGGGGDSWG
jgi:hypothetical protein